MNKQSPMPALFLRAAAVALLAGLASPLVSSAVAAPDPAAPKAPEAGEKNHYLFMGANLQLRIQGEPRNVLGIEGEHYTVQIGEKIARVPLAHSSDLVLRRSFKLADQAVRIDNLKTRLGYMTAEKGGLKRGGLNLETVSGESGLQYVSEVNKMEALGAMALAQTSGTTYTLTVFEPTTYTVTPSEAGMVYAGAESSLATVVGTPATAVNDEQPPVLLFPEKPDPFSVDSLEVSFAVSSPVVIPKAYVVVLVKYALRDKPAEEQTTFFSKGLPVLGPKPVAISIPQNGFPKGYLFKEAQVHVYNHGREVASNVAEKQLSLSEADAHAYLVIQYLVSHKDDVLAPRPLFKKYPLKLKDRLQDPLYNQVLFVKISKEGFPVGAYSDEACTRKADAELETLLAGWRFLPAVNKGKAVEGVAKVRPADTSI